MKHRAHHAAGTRTALVTNRKPAIKIISDATSHIGHIAGITNVANFGTKLSVFSADSL